MLDIMDVAETCRVSEKTVRRWITRVHVQKSSEPRARTSVENLFALLLFSMGSIHTYFGASGKLGAVQSPSPMIAP
jgi:hypothetical protein